VVVGVYENANGAEKANNDSRKVERREDAIDFVRKILRRMV